jgi:hypothetical protein
MKKNYAKFGIIQEWFKNGIFMNNKISVDLSPTDKIALNSAYLGVIHHDFILFESPF